MEAGWAMECSLFTLVGIATVYAEPYIGQPLYCGGLYDVDMSPWIALPVGTDWQCGDPVRLRFEDGSTLTARAMDAGPFGAFCVKQPDGACLPIIVDIPAHLAPFPLSGPVELNNLGEAARKCLAVEK